MSAGSLDPGIRSNGSPLAELKRIIERERGPAPRPGERCELCGEPIPDDHSHLVNIEHRNLLCACRACYLLFTHSGAGQGRFRAVPDRHLFDPAFSLTGAQWEALQIPVRMAFFFKNSELDRFVAFYPSPAGATESLLPLETWDEIIAANPGVADLEPDVEALLLDHTDSGTACYLVPISACYELVGLVRLHWRGFSGGAAAWHEIDTYFDGLRRRSRPVAARGEL